MGDRDDGNFFSYRPGFEEVDGSRVAEIPRVEEFGLRNVGCDFIPNVMTGGKTLRRLLSRQEAM